MKPTSPSTNHQQVATQVGPAQWNKATGALLVDIGGVTDVGTAAIVAGLGGGKTLADVCTAIGKLVQAP